jgi:hypothetical protein
VYLIGEKDRDSDAELGFSSNLQAVTPDSLGVVFVFLHQLHVVARTGQVRARDAPDSPGADNRQIHDSLV